MSIATTVSDALAFEEVDFDILSHTPTYTAAATARRAGIDPEKLAKAVLLKDANGYLLAVVPANRAIDLPALRRELHRPLDIAEERDLDDLFCDCSVGSVPPIGTWYRVPTVVDTCLRQQPDIYFEAGDHRSLVHVSESVFEQLLGDPYCFSFSHPG
jgi:Ala-tRNA(Pro) deacylase